MKRTFRNRGTEDVFGGSACASVKGTSCPRCRLPAHGPPTHPGQMLLEEFIRPLGITQTDFAARLRVSYPRLNEIIRGKRAVSPDTALRLERVLGMPAHFWLGLQLDWDLWHAMRTPAAADIELLEPLSRS